MVSESWEDWGLWAQDPALTPIHPTVPPEAPQVLGGPFVSLVAGVPANLTCRSHGDARPTPELLWFRDGIRLDGTTFHQVRSKSLCMSCPLREIWGPLRSQAYPEERGAWEGRGSTVGTLGMCLRVRTPEPDYPGSNPGSATC